MLGMRPEGSRSQVRLFVTYAAISFVPVLVLGVVLVLSLRAEAQKRGLAEGRSEAALIADTAVEPLLAPGSVDRSITPSIRAGLQKLSDNAILGQDLLRLRVRDQSGRVVFSDDGSGFGVKPEDEALDAAHGAMVARLTHLNADDNDDGNAGVQSVEIYVPLTAGHPARQVGVLELYLPYAPINRDVTTGLHQLYLDLGIGLFVLYVILFLITASVSRGLRREVALNAFIAEHDPLTELPNRTLFRSRVKEAVWDASVDEQSVAVAFIDLDHFKDINDTLGHQNGDRLLTELANRLSAAMRDGDTVARLGGDEFGLILRDVVDAEQALRELRNVIEREVEVSELPLSVQASVGYVVAPQDGTDADTLMQRADVAMYVAKAQHVGVVRYDSALDHYDAANLTLVGELRQAIDAGELVLHYQPQTNIPGGRVIAVEALVRWQHPTHGLLPPDRFLPLAERTDLIDRLTTWVLRTAITEIRDLGPAAAGLTVSVNVSARSIGRPELAQEIIDTLHESDVAPEQLMIEVTETALLADPQRAAKVLARLADQGVRVSLDDFGRGQTSLGYLSALPIDELKIDKSFVMDVLEDPAHAAIVRSIIDLGHNLALNVVGEGVETEEILDYLRRSGCDIAQGYLLARPMPVANLREWLGRGEASEQVAA